MGCKGCQSGHNLGLLPSHPSHHGSRSKVCAGCSGCCPFTHLLFGRWEVAFVRIPSLTKVGQFPSESSLHIPPFCHSELDSEWPPKMDHYPLQGKMDHYPLQGKMDHYPLPTTRQERRWSCYGKTTCHIFL